jgi:hypothetical protein
LRISAELGERLPELSGRKDVIVTCEPGTRSGAPAAFFPDLATLEIDSKVFAPLNPPTIRPAVVGDEERYPVAWGALVHEAAHAAHSKWRIPPPLRGTAVDEAGQVLEESRAECAHLARRPEDRRYLRACVSSLVLADINTHAPANRWQAAQAAGLILARRDAGILDDDEVAPLKAAVTTILGEDLLTTLADIWTAAHRTGDEDAAAMLAHARAWCQVLGAAEEHPPPGAPDPDCGQLAEAIEAAVAKVDENEAVVAAVDAAHRARKQERAAQAAQGKQAVRTAEKVFTPGGRPHTPAGRGQGRRGKSPVTGTRLPTGAEKAAAGQLARGLRAAAYRERTVTVTASASPPGRLSMRGALARDAQRAAGATPTAQPWITTQRRHTPSPPLRVGIAVDVSGSMGAATGPIASAAWIVAKATALTDPDSRSATVAYDYRVTAITAPGHVPTRVTEFDAEGFGHSLDAAIDALQVGLELDRPGRGRLLVIVSDGYYAPAEAARAAARITALNKTGCAVLWLDFEDDSLPLPGTALVHLTDPTQAAAAIAQAATRALAT